jgi:hypothetical protein
VNAGDEDEEHERPGKSPGEEAECGSKSGTSGAERALAVRRGGRCPASHPGGKEKNENGGHVGDRRQLLPEKKIGGEEEHGEEKHRVEVAFVACLEKFEPDQAEKKAPPGPKSVDGAVVEEGAGKGGGGEGEKKSQRRSPAARPADERHQHQKAGRGCDPRNEIVDRHRQGRQDEDRGEEEKTTPLEGASVPLCLPRPP